MSLFLTVLHVMVCVVLILVVMVQRGKGAEIGAVFGGGASTTVFGSRGAGNFLTKLTTGAAVLFMLTSLLLSYFGAQRASEGLFPEEAPLAAPEAPAGESAPSGAAAESPFVEVPAADPAPEAEPESAP